MRFLFSIPQLLLFALISLPNVLAILLNVTVDDTTGDPVTGTHITYTPIEAWNLGQDCDGCTALLDAKQTFKGTWHDGTFNSIRQSNTFPPNVTISASVAFTGSSLYVFCILTHTSDGPDGNSDMTFFIDDDVVGTFVQAPTGSKVVDYNSPVYVNQSLPAGPHNFTLVNGHVNGLKSLVLLDYLVYSMEDSPSPLMQSSRSSSSVTVSPVPLPNSPALSASSSASSFSPTTITSSSNRISVGSMFLGLVLLPALGIFHALSQL